jgi:hypothetical protein
MAWLAVFLVIMGPLILGALVVECTRSWRDRIWIRRLRNIQAGRDAQRRGA